MCVCPAGTTAVALKPLITQAFLKVQGRPFYAEVPTGAEPARGGGVDADFALLDIPLPPEGPPSVAPAPAPAPAGDTPLPEPTGGAIPGGPGPACVCLNLLCSHLCLCVPAEVPLPAAADPPTA